jgi:hypothetical protein
MQLDEGDDVPARAAPEALEESLVAVDVEGGRLLLMERAQPLERRPGLPQRHDLADDRDDVGLGFEIIDEGRREEGHE